MTQGRKLQYNRWLLGFNRPSSLLRPMVDHVGPILHHRSALLSVFRLVVDRPDPFLLVSKTLLDPVGVVTSFMQQCASSLSGLPLLFGNML